MRARRQRAPLCTVRGQLLEGARDRPSMDLSSQTYRHCFSRPPTSFSLLSLQVMDLPSACAAPYCVSLTTQQWNIVFKKVHFALRKTDNYDQHFLNSPDSRTIVSQFKMVRRLKSAISRKKQHVKPSQKLVSEIAQDKHLT